MLSQWGLGYSLICLFPFWHISVFFAQKEKSFWLQCLPMYDSYISGDN